MRVRKPAAAVEPPRAKLSEIPEIVIQQAETYRGRANLRWRMEIQNGKTHFVIASECKCGRWWGWVEESLRNDLVSLLAEGCPGCDGA